MKKSLKIHQIHLNEEKTLSTKELNNCLGGENIGWGTVLNGAWQIVSGIATLDWINDQAGGDSGPGTPPMNVTGGRSTWEYSDTFPSDD